MFLSIPLAQTISFSPETIKAIQDIGIAIVAIICITVVVWRLLGVVDRNTRVLDKIGDRNADYQTNSLKEKENTREWIKTASNGVAEMTRGIVEMQQKLGMAIEGNTDVLKGKDGVLEVLRSSAEQLTGLANQTKGVVETAQLIFSKLEQVKGAMAASDSDIKQQIEAIQTQLSTLASTVQTIPEAVNNAETNIIAAINKQPPVPSPPQPTITDETMATKPPLTNGQGKEISNVQSSSD